MNFVAVEPVARGSRGLSELEASALDRVNGKAMWTGDTFEDDPKPRPPWQPARGVIGSAGGKKTLSFYLYVEPFDNGARPVVEVQAPRGSAPRGRLPGLLRAGQRADAGLCPDRDDGQLRPVAPALAQGPRRGRARAVPVGPVRPANGFAEHRQWGVGTLLVVDGEAVVAARPDEPDPATRLTPATSTRAGTTWARPRPSTGGRRPGAISWHGSTPARPTGRRHAAIPGGVLVRELRAGGPIPSRPAVRLRHHARAARGPRLSPAVGAAENSDRTGSSGKVSNTRIR